MTTYERRHGDQELDRLPSEDFFGPLASPLFAARTTPEGTRTVIYEFDPIESMVEAVIRHESDLVVDALDMLTDLTEPEPGRNFGARILELTSGATRIDQTRFLVDHALSNQGQATSRILIMSIALDCLRLRPNNFDGQIESEIHPRLQTSAGAHPDFTLMYNVLVRLQEGAPTRDERRMAASPLHAKSLLGIDNQGRSLESRLTDNEATRQLACDTMNRVTTKSIVRHMLSLIDDPDTDAEQIIGEVRRRFFEELFARTPQYDDREELFRRISSERLEHILAGDRTGGGHMLSAVLERPGSRIVTPEEVRQETRDKYGFTYAAVRHETGELKLHSFFPDRWSREDVIAAAQYPDGIYLRQVRQGRIHEIIRKNGAPLLRVVNSLTEEVLTVHPMNVENPCMSKQMILEQAVRAG